MVYRVNHYLLFEKGEQDELPSTCQKAVWGALLTIVFAFWSFGGKVLSNQPFYVFPIINRYEAGDEPDLAIVSLIISPSSLRRFRVSESG